MKKRYKFKIDKLVRARSNVRLNAQGVITSYRIMELEEYIQRLKDKLLEEAEEVVTAKNQEEYLTECADVLEVVHAFAAAVGLSYEQIEQKRLKIKEVRGGFDERIYQEYAEMDADNDLIEYFRKDPEKYPEIE
jgi:predicted house-cleaning noncanonical NTP pyrophosphatase (MazG superfamily)